MIEDLIPAGIVDFDGRKVTIFFYSTKLFPFLLPLPPAKTASGPHFSKKLQVKSKISLKLSIIYEAMHEPQILAEERG